MKRFKTVTACTYKPINTASKVEPLLNDGWEIVSTCINNNDKLIISLVKEEP